MIERGTTVRLLALAASLSATVPVAAAHDERCGALFEQGAAALAAEQYAKMLRIADDRMRLCPDPESAFLLGLAQANMVDGLIVTDPAEREQLRLSALRHLRIAAAGGDLKPVLQFTVHDWIVHLQSLGPADEAEIEGSEPDLEHVEDAPETVEPLEVPPAPPPQPQPVFPWGPVLTGALGAAALTTGIVLGISASESRDEARAAADRLREIASDLDDEALTRVSPFFGGPRLSGAFRAVPRSLKGGLPFLRPAKRPENRRPARSSAEKGRNPSLSEAVRRTRALNEEADSKAKWSTVLLASGAVAAVTSVVWYVALPPKGKWRWVATPAGMRTTVRF